MDSSGVLGTYSIPWVPMDSKGVPGTYSMLWVPMDSKGVPGTYSTLGPHGEICFGRGLCDGIFGATGKKFRFSILQSKPYVP